MVTTNMTDSEEEKQLFHHTIFNVTPEYIRALLTRMYSNREYRNKNVDFLLRPDNNNIELLDNAKDEGIPLLLDIGSRRKKHSYYKNLSSILFMNVSLLLHDELPEKEYENWPDHLEILSSTIIENASVFSAIKKKRVRRKDFNEVYKNHKNPSSFAPKFTYDAWCFSYFDSQVYRDSLSDLSENPERPPSRDNRPGVTNTGEIFLSQVLGNRSSQWVARPDPPQEAEPVFTFENTVDPEAQVLRESGRYGG